MRSAAIALFVVTTLSAHAQPVVFSIAGNDHRTTRANGIAVGWSFSDKVEHVTISAFLANSGGDAGGTAYLVKRIAPGITPASEIASTRFELPANFKGGVPFFTELDLPAGEYWLVIGATRDVEWVASSPLELHLVDVAHYLGTTQSDLAGIADYPPASRFGMISDRVGYQIEITGIVHGDWCRTR
jgi:hypothetical protein